MPRALRRPFEAAAARLPLGGAGRGALIAFGVRVGGAVLGYGAQVALARLLGEAEYGVFAVAWSLVLVLGHVAALGLGETVVRLLPGMLAAEDRAGARGLARFGARGTLAGAAGFAVLGGAVLALASPRLDPAYPATLALALACLVPFAYQDWLEGLARALGRPGLALGAPYLARPVLMAGGAAAAIALGAAGNAPTALAVALATTVVTCLVQHRLVGSAVEARVGRGEGRADGRTWLLAGLPVTGALLLDQMTAYADLYIVAAFRDAGEVALYHAAVKTLVLAAFAHYAIGFASGPAFARALARGDDAGLRDELRSSGRLTLVAVGLTAVGVAVMGWPMLILFGDAYTAAYPTLLILAGGLLVRALAGQGETLLLMGGHGRLNVVIGVGALVTITAGALAMVPPFGLAGAALASSLAFGARAALTIIFVRARLGVNCFALAPRLADTARP